MKKYSWSLLLLAVTCTFSFCNTAKKATATPTATVFYDTDVKALIETKCTPCHLPSKGGNKASLENYDAVKNEIDDMIRRVELNPGDRGFMPFKHAKLSEAEINILKTWKAEGLTKSK